MGNTPSLSKDAIGALKYEICTCCPGGGTFAKNDMCCCCCPQAVRGPSGPEWDAVIASGEWPRFQKDAETIAAASPKSCMGCCEDVFKMKADLDEQWLSTANEFLGTHGLRVEVLAFYTSDGKSSTPVRARMSACALGRSLHADTYPG